MINLYPLPDHVVREIAWLRATVIYCEHKFSSDVLQQLNELEDTLLHQYAHATKPGKNTIIDRLHELKHSRNEYAALSYSMRQSHEH